MTGRGWLELLVASLVILILALGIHFARAAEGHTHEGAAGRFYQSWMMPDNRAVSCCHQEDCAPSQSRMVNGKWQARWTDAEDWTDVPASKIETDRDSPDGQSHLCGRRYGFNAGGFTVFCFIPAGGS